MTAVVLRTVRLLLVGVLALAAVGCGGGDSEVSEDEFIDEFDSVCEDLNDELDDIEADVGDLEDDDVEGVDDLVEEAGEVFSDGIDELSEIDPPEDLQDDVEELLGLLRDRAEVSDDLTEALDDVDSEAIEDAFDEIEELDADIQDVSEDIGLECYPGDEESDDISDDLSDSTGDFSDDFSDSSDDFSDDVSDDFSDDFSDSLGDLGEPVPPSDVIPEYGTVDRDARFDGLADSCYAGDLNDCDRLYNLTPVSPSINSYEGYGATCGGRLAQEEPGTCAARG
jgi:hypothetical protein